MLKEKLQKDLNQSLKSGDQFKRLVLGMVITAVKNREVAKRTQLSKTVSDIAQLEKQSQLTDEETMAVIASEIKKRKESSEQFTAGGRPELAQKEKNEIEILADYLPVQLNEEEVRAEVKRAIAQVGARDIKDMGKVIETVMAKIKGRADGSAVSRIVKDEMVLKPSQ